MRKKQVAISDEESARAGIDATVTAKRLLKKANGTAEKKRLQRATAIENGVKESVQVRKFIYYKIIIIKLLL